MLHALNLEILHLINGLRLPVGAALVLTAASNNSLLHLVVLAGPYVYLWCRYPALKCRARLAAGVLGASVAVIVARGLAAVLPFSVRPMYDPASGYHSVPEMYAPDFENWSSFPSDTAALCVAMSLGFFALAPVLSGSACLVAVAFFALPRIYMGLHYPSDILGGALIGLVCAGTAGRLGQTQTARNLVGGSIAKYTTTFYPAALLVLVSTSEMFDGFRASIRTLITALR